MPRTTSTALSSFSHDQHYETDAAKRKGGNQAEGVETHNFRDAFMNLPSLAGEVPKWLKGIYVVHVSTSYVVPETDKI